MELIKSKTYKNLAASFAGECQAYTRYKFLEYGARYNKLNCLAEVIDTIAFNEFQHARMFYTFIQKAQKQPIKNIDISTGYPFKEKWDVTQNMLLDAEDEIKEAEDIYPEFEKTAREEGFVEIAELYHNIIQVEKMHADLFNKIHTQLEKGTMYKKPKKVVWKCSQCGYTAEGKEPWKQCPLCEAEQGFVMLNLED